MPISRAPASNLAFIVAPGSATADAQTRGFAVAKDSRGAALHPSRQGANKGRAASPRTRERANETDHGYRQTLQARRGARSPRQCGRGGSDDFGSQRLRATEGPDRNLSGRRIPGELRPEGRSWRSSSTTPASPRPSRRSRPPPAQARSATARSSSSMSKKPCASAPAKPARPRSEFAPSGQGDTRVMKIFWMKRLAGLLLAAAIAGAPLAPAFAQTASGRRRRRRGGLFQQLGGPAASSAPAASAAASAAPAASAAACVGSRRRRHAPSAIGRQRQLRRHRLDADLLGRWS